MVRILFPLIVLFLAFLEQAHSARLGLYLNYSLGYISDSDSAENFSFSTLRNEFVVGGALGNARHIILATQYNLWSRDYSISGTTGKISMTQIGPGVIFLLGGLKMSVFWFPYSKGSRTLSSATEDVDGSGYSFSIGPMLKLSKKVFIGGSINYTATSLEFAVSNNTQTSVSHTYTTIYPSIEFNILF